VQVIVVTEYAGQNPEVVDHQVTYPLTSALLSVPGAKDVRGFSMFEQSFVYVIFDDNTDIYWARSRVLEYLNFARDRLPAGVQPKLGPDATGVGWVYQYVLYPGYYSPDHPKGLRHNKKHNLWMSLDDWPKDMRGWEVVWRADRGILERVCAHGVGHPDPDQFSYWKANGMEAEAVHGCCGCCTGAPKYGIFAGQDTI
jgi:hypothetical protein